MITVAQQIAWLTLEVSEIDRVASGLPGHERLQNRLAIAKATLSTLTRLKEAADKGQEAVT